MTPQEYLVQKATAAGIDPLQLATVMHYESGLNPNRWGGKGGNYFGLIQFGPEERQRYGVVPGQTPFEGQTDATLNFLRDRGYKPGMGLIDLYSTINAGTPGRYNASDGNGTVSTHVAAMQPAMAAAQKWLGGAAPVAAPDGQVRPQAAPSIASQFDPALLQAAAFQPGPASFADALPSGQAQPAAQKQAVVQAELEKRRKQALFTQPIATLYGAG